MQVFTIKTYEIDLIGAARYASFVTLEEARAPDGFIANEWDGPALPLLHGFPLRAVFPPRYGNEWVKWLLELKVK